ncbi:glycosyltransferase family 2 protein [Luteimonas aquatica]|uniref:glycosyltransferase family 2 protein n=1 Tax=Luteimonas aquatica TaxID=450364 RepID=UPI001F56F329|nr:glycosyltransferase [Luteimonas aquatica]
MAELPVVLLPVGADDDALDACLGALEANTPAGTRVWLADDAQCGPRGYAVIERWIARTGLSADYTRRQRAIGQVAHLDEMLKACGDADVIVLAPDALPTPGWATQLAACFARDASIATATPWCNAGETAAWPRCGEIGPVPGDAERIARAAAAMAPRHPELPAAVDHAVLLRGRARLKAGGLDAASYASWYAALIDLSLRLAGLGWRNALCETAFVARGGEGGPADGDLDALAARWPHWHARLAGFLMDDPLHEVRERLSRLHAEADATQRQRDLFAEGAADADAPALEAPAPAGEPSGVREGEDAPGGGEASPP